MNKQIKASFMISLMLITMVSAVFNVNAIYIVNDIEESNSIMDDSGNDTKCSILFIQCTIALMISLKLLEVYKDIYPIFPSIALKILDISDYYYLKGNKYIEIARDLNCDWIQV